MPEQVCDIVYVTGYMTPRDGQHVVFPPLWVLGESSGDESYAPPHPVKKTIVYRSLPND